MELSRDATPTVMPPDLVVSCAPTTRHSHADHLPKVKLIDPYVDRYQSSQDVLVIVGIKTWETLGQFILWTETSVIQLYALIGMFAMVIFHWLISTSYYQLKLLLFKGNNKNLTGRLWTK